MTHSANELDHIADILGPDLVARASGIRVGYRTLSGKRLEQAQLIASETSHMLVFHYPDVASILDNSCYVVIEGITYIVDYDPIDPQIPRHNMWLEVYCHVSNKG